MRVVTIGAPAARVAPRTHSTYAVTDRRLARPERLRSFNREIFRGSASGTYSSSSAAIPCEACSKRL